MMDQQYHPGNATEGDAFERRWCHHCENNKPTRCEILAYAQGGGQPLCWTFDGGVPCCTEFVEDKANPARCPFTMEMQL